MTTLCLNLTLTWKVRISTVTKCTPQKNWSHFDFPIVPHIPGTVPHPIRSFSSGVNYRLLTGSSNWHLRTCPTQTMHPHTYLNMWRAVRITQEQTSTSFSIRSPWRFNSGQWHKRLVGIKNYQATLLKLAQQTHILYPVPGGWTGFYAVYIQWCPLRNWKGTL